MVLDKWNSPKRNNKYIVHGSWRCQLFAFLKKVFFSTVVKYLKCITYRLYIDGADLSNIAFNICQACFLSATQIIHRWWRLHLFKPGRDSKGGQFKVTEVNLRFICLRDRSISICLKDQSIILIVSNTLFLCNSNPTPRITKQNMNRDLPS